MRNPSSWILLPVGVSLVAALHAGCWSDYEDIYLPLTDPKLVADGGNDGDGDGGKPPACAGDPTQDATLVRDECGVFVSASAAADGDGTKARPFAKLADAIAEAESSGKRAYACAGKAFDESVTISAGIELIGGFDCANAWAWSEAARATVNAPADAIALTIQASATGAKVDGFTLTAVSPSDMKSGKSSIAVAVADVEATLVRCDVVAGDGADGADGSTPTDSVIKGADAPTMGADGSPTDACVLPGGVAGGVPGVTACDDGMSSGGSGGKGGITGMPDGNGNDGTDGQPTVNTNHGSGATASGDCSDGTKGKGGDAGSAGPGGSSVNDSLSLSGIANVASTDGQPGTKAQGGGGGGGEKSGVFCKVGSNTIDGPGPSGGGGGGGGCGGKGGGGGKAGGSSVAILSLGTKLTLTGVTLAVGKAGNGGKGANGQAGAVGGHGADGGASSGQAGSIPACNGGDGGLGGAGGPGGGGRGGHAIGIAFAKTPSTTPMIKTFGAGTAGNPGDPGAVGGNSGEQGSAGQCWDFEKHATCGQ